ncbi:E3 ubiquitin-protein ligase SIAH2-like isoform X3 [Bacillus rossius redtenbacheri]|uniref:E3 ubiquitin-protein ligase SIAH2-like isoform X3 n=1 Tax=Bacillus rossius redtenbacheri TaxID=93214 RepID=UPI002FDD1B2F
MLERIKHWEAAPPDMEVAAGRRSDPRELPRPRKPGFSSRRSSFSVVSIFPPREGGEIAPCAENTENTENTDPGKAVCPNCAELDAMLECAVCLETLQGAGIYSCALCGNSVCWACCLKVDRCPFCRSNLPFDRRTRNLAMERLVAKLALQCKNFRWGCLERLSQPERQEHERACPFSRDACPVQPCPWRGDAALLTRHAREAHGLVLLVGDSITVDIARFRAKVAQSDRRARRYCVSLFCHSAVFTCRIHLRRGTLRMAFAKLCCTEGDARARRLFGASLDIRSSFKTLRGIMPIAHCSRNAKELSVSCEGLLSPWKKTDENVKIAITIRPLT